MAQDYTQERTKAVHSQLRSEIGLALRLATSHTAKGRPFDQAEMLARADVIAKSTSIVNVLCPIEATRMTSAQIMQRAKALRDALATFVEANDGRDLLV